MDQEPLPGSGRRNYNDKKNEDKLSKHIQVRNKKRNALPGSARVCSVQWRSGEFDKSGFKTMTAARAKLREEEFIENEEFGDHEEQSQYHPGA